MTDVTVLEKEPQPFRSFERIESADWVGYEFKPLFTMEEFTRHPKYDKFLDFNMGLFRGRD